MFTKRLLSLSLLTAGICLAPQAASAITLIDDFSSGLPADNLILDAIGSASSENAVADLSILGGYRDMKLTVTTHPGSTLRKASEQVDTFSSSLIFSNDTGVQSTAELMYDGMGAGSLGAVDLTNMGAFQQVSLRVLSADNFPGGIPDPANVTMAFTDIDGDVAFKTIDMPDGTNYNLNFTFDSIEYAAIDFTQINKIHVTFVATLNGDYEFDFIKATTNIPEPITASLSVLALGSLGLFAGRRNRA